MFHTVSDLLEPDVLVVQSLARARLSRLGPESLGRAMPSLLRCGVPISFDSSPMSPRNRGASCTGYVVMFLAVSAAWVTATMLDSRNPTEERVAATPLRPPAAVGRAP